MRLNLSIIALCTIILISCSDNSTSSTDPDCSGRVEISVSSGTTPTFTWTPECAIFFLIVEPADSGTDLWMIATEGSNSIGSGVKYGEVPEGAQELHDPVELVFGNEYKIAMYRYTDSNNEEYALIGTKQFTIH